LQIIYLPREPSTHKHLDAIRAIIVSALLVSSDYYFVELDVIFAVLLPLQDAAMVLTYTMLLFDAIGDGR